MTLWIKKNIRSKDVGLYLVKKPHFVEPYVQDYLIKGNNLPSIFYFFLAVNKIYRSA